VRKLAEEQAAATQRWLEKTVDWQKLAGGNLMATGSHYALNSTGEPTDALQKAGEKAVKGIDIFGKKLLGDASVVSAISKNLSKVYSAELNGMVRDGINIAGKRATKGLKDTMGKATLSAKEMADSTRSFFDEYVKHGRLNWEILDLVRKLAEEQAAATQRWLEKTVDWQKLAGGSLMAGASSTGLRSDDAGSEQPAADGLAEEAWLDAHAQGSQG